VGIFHLNPVVVTPGGAGAPARAATERVRGVCTVMFAFDIGYGIDLAAARRAVGGEFVHDGGARDAPTPRRGGAPPRPLRVEREAAPIEVKGGGTTWATRPGASVSLWDFGGASVSLRIEIDAMLDGLVELATGLYGNPRLLSAARAVAEDLVRALGSALASPEISPLVEDYAVYELSCPARLSADAGELVPEAGAVLARVLRAEAAALSADETTEALSARVSYGPADVTLVDWNAALMVGEGAGTDTNSDERAVLEYANMELLELRALDVRLDAALDSAFAAAHRGRWWAEATDLATIGKLQVEAALLFEAVNNAAKLIGDQYLSRLYRAAARRLHLGEWDATILRKLQTLESLYEKMNDRRQNRRMEILEWIVIVLIAAEILMSLVPWRGW
jgi:hypothetical protein